jgi:phage-related tail fiber protein
MANVIKIKRSILTPIPASLQEGELAYSEASKGLFIGKSGGNIVQIGGEMSNDAIIANIQNVVGAMVSSNVETGLTVTYDSTNKKLDFIFTPVASGATAGTYNQVTINSSGIVTSGANPTTLVGYGITDATPSSHIGSNGSSHAVATTSLPGFMSATDKTNLNALYTWYSNMTTADGDSLINTINEMLAAFNTTPESVNIYSQITNPTSMTLDGGTY